jgi:hypothetical protein
LFTTSTQIKNVINKNDAHKSASYLTANKLKTVLQQKHSELKKFLISKFQRSVVITFVSTNFKCAPKVQAINIIREKVKKNFKSKNKKFENDVSVE